MALTACTSVGRCASETSTRGVGREGFEVQLLARGRLSRRATPVCRHPCVSRRSMHRGDGTERRIVFDRQTTPANVDPRQFPRSGRRQRGNRSQPQFAAPACSDGGSSIVACRGLSPRLGDDIPGQRNVARRDLDQFQGRIEAQRDLSQRLAVGFDIQLDRQLDAAERKVVGRRLAGQNGLRPDFFASRLGQSQPATGPASQLQSPAVETGVRRALVG